MATGQLSIGGSAVWYGLLGTLAVLAVVSALPVLLTRKAHWPQ